MRHTPAAGRRCLRAPRRGSRLALLLAVGLAAAAARAQDRPPRTPAAFRAAGDRPRGKLTARALAGPMAKTPEIVFAVRAPGRDGHWYANFGHWSSSPDRMMYGRDGGKLCRLDLRTGKVRTILDDPRGSVRDPHVHYDGRKVLFSYRKGGTKHFHLYEIGVDATGLRQLTDGPFDDIEPIYLPNDDILFCSSRCNRWVQCWHTQVAILYRCGPDGQDLRPISCNVEQDNTPWMLPDGRIVFMRWEYVDRSRVRYHHLWTINPDGTGVMACFGNMHPGTVMLDAKPIGRTNKIVSIFSPGHGRKEHAGRLAVVNPDAGPDERKWVRTVGRSSNYRDPYALSEELFLVAENNRLLLIDLDGTTQEIHRTGRGDMMAHEPRPLAARPREPMPPPRVNYKESTGRLVLADVTHGRNMRGVRPGEIKKLLVMETLPKPVNFSGTMEPISHRGTFTLPRILGTVPVEPDGSAYVELPALRPLFFVALDGDDLSVKRMQSFVTVMPGETTSCSGCHENRTDTARFKDLLATRRPPRQIEPIDGVPDVFDFPRDIQPILDSHCVKCHNYKQRPPADLPLVGDRSAWYSHSYFALMARGLISHGLDADGNKAPRRIGTAASRLIHHLRKGHKNVKLSELDMAKIRLWVEAGAPYPGTYASLGSGMVRVSADAGVLQRRCAGCHGARRPDRRRPTPVRLKTPDELLYNLTEPARSPILLAALSRRAGGWGLCKSKSAPEVFASTDDADYRKLLARIEKAKGQLDGITRFDMPNFRPNQHYVREMTRYGILRPTAGNARRIDPYALDQAYWQSFWYRPARR